jgi:hypothetical protein
MLDRSRIKQTTIEKSTIMNIGGTDIYKHALQTPIEKGEYSFTLKPYCVPNPPSYSVDVTIGELQASIKAHCKSKRELLHQLPADVLNHIRGVLNQ